MVEKQLKKRIAKGEPEALVELYDQHGEALLRYLTARVGATNARDVLQNVFTRLLRYHRKLAKAKNLTAYIFQTARNVTIRFQQETENVAASRAATIDNAVGLTDPSVSSVKSVEDQETVQALLAHLDEASKEIVQLKIFSGLTFKEVAQIVAMPEQTTATKYRRAIEKLKQLAQGEIVSGSDDSELYQQTADQDSRVVKE